MTENASLSPQEWSFWDTWMRAQRLLASEVDRTLRRDFGISKAEFSILVTLQAAPAGRLRVTDLAESLDWEKGRVAHLLTRMERRALLESSGSGAAGRRYAIALTPAGEQLVDRAIRGHASNIRRLALDRLAPEQAAAIGTWSRDLIEHLAPTPPEHGAPDEC